MRVVVWWEGGDWLSTIEQLIVGPTRVILLGLLQPPRQSAMSNRITFRPHSAAIRVALNQVTIVMESTKQNPNQLERVRIRIRVRIRMTSSVAISLAV